MPPINNNYALPPAGASQEIIPGFLWDTIIYPAGAGNTGCVLGDSVLFNPQETKSKKIRSHTFPLPLNRYLQIQAIRANHNLKFPSEEQIWVFEEYSYLEISLEDKSYFQIPLAAILPWTRMTNAGQVYGVYNPSTGGVPESSTTVAVTSPLLSEWNNRSVALPKNAHWYKLPQPVDLPIGTSEIKFIVPPLTTSKIDAVDAGVTPIKGVKLGAGMYNAANDYVMAIKFDIAGMLIRSTK